MILRSSNRRGRKPLLMCDSIARNGFESFAISATTWQMHFHAALEGIGVAPLLPLRTLPEDRLSKDRAVVVQSRPSPSFVATSRPSGTHIFQGVLEIDIFRKRSTSLWDRRRADFSPMTTLRPFGPSVILPLSASWLTPRRIADVIFSELLVCQGW